jgi:serine/threonine protein phosphatase PrpC
MSSFRKFFRSIFGRIFPQRDALNLSEQPTRPLDADALARAIKGEGRRHVSTGYAMSITPEASRSTNSLYLMMAQSDGLNALPDFGIIGIAEVGQSDGMNPALSRVALSTLAYQLAQKAILDFLELEGFENTSPLQDIVIEAMHFTDQTILESDPNVRYSLTAGLVFAEMMILGHRGETRAYQIDRHHIERITPTDSGIQASKSPSDSTVEPTSVGVEGLSEDESSKISVYSRPVPRDGYIMLCTRGLWKNMSEQDIYKIVTNQEDPNVACQTLVSQIGHDHPDQELSVLMLYFPPDFVPWR